METRVKADRDSGYAVATSAIRGDPASTGAKSGFVKRADENLPKGHATNASQTRQRMIRCGVGLEPQRRQERTEIRQIYHVHGVEIAAGTVAAGGAEDQAIDK